MYALEEASILASESSSSASRAGDAGGAGSGAMDVSWLNSRNDTVGKDKEAELWAAARKFGESVTTPKTRDMSGNMDID